jgi:hypothetical protein
MTEETKTAKPEVKKADVPNKPKRFLCKVHRLGTERENTDLVISVNVVGKKKKEFFPNQEVVLLDYHINVLRNAIISTQIELPTDSTVYSAKNPIAEAEKNWPGFKAVYGGSGMIVMEKNTPLYSVEVLKEM